MMDMKTFGRCCWCLCWWREKRVHEQQGYKLGEWGSSCMMVVHLELPQSGHEHLAKTRLLIALVH